MSFLSRTFALFVPSLLLALSPSARAVDLTAGPMIGHVTEKSARVWMQFPIAGQVSIDIFDTQRAEPLSSLRTDLEGPYPFVCDVPLGGLQPDHSYRIEVKFEGQPVKLPETVIRTAPIPGDEATFSVAFGSDLALAPFSTATQPSAAPMPAIPVFKSIEKLRPRALILLGNMGHLPRRLSDFPPTRRAAFRFISEFHSAIRRTPDFQNLLHTTPCYALYNDRDFGTLDCDSHFVYQQESLVSFEHFWPNPDWGTPENPGCFCNFTLGDVDFFLLDCRTFRNTGGDSKVLFGQPQLDWLKKSLKASNAHFKILAAPCLLWGDDPQHPSPDSWSSFPSEQQPFLRWLADNQINGLVAIAGNQPAGELTRFDPKTSGPKLRYPLFTLASSTLFSAEPPSGAIPANASRVSNPLAEDNFGTLDLGGEREHRFLTLRLHDQTGKTRIEQTLFAEQLKN